MVLPSDFGPINDNIQTIDDNIQTDQRQKSNDFSGNIKSIHVSTTIFKRSVSKNDEYFQMSFKISIFDFIRGKK